MILRVKRIVSSFFILSAMIAAVIFFIALAVGSIYVLFGQRVLAYEAFRISGAFGMVLFATAMVVYRIKLNGIISMQIRGGPE